MKSRYKSNTTSSLLWNCSLAATLILLFALTGVRLKAAELCTDKMLLDGSESLISYGLDSTRNWWAITAPYDSLYHLWVNGHKSPSYQLVQGLHFSPDGEHWSAWAMMQNQWRLIVDGSEKQFACTLPGEIKYSASSKLIYTYYEGSQEVIDWQKQKLYLAGRVGTLYLSPNNDKLCFVLGQAGAKTLVINGKAGTMLDDVKVFGFWTDGQLLYAAQSGSLWRIYRGEEELAGPYNAVPEIAINAAGTVAAAIVTQGSFQQVLLFADEYTRPIISQQYQSIDALVLHPTMAMWAARCQQAGSPLVLMTNAEYSAGTTATGAPFFTADGKELVFVGCDAECFISINGKKNYLNQSLYTDGTFARKSGASTFAYSSTTSLIFREVERKELWVSKMCDETSLPRYNWRQDAYEALGRINSRLYLLSCMK